MRGKREIPHETRDKALKVANIVIAYLTIASSVMSISRAVDIIKKGI